MTPVAITAKGSKIYYGRLTFQERREMDQLGSPHGAPQAFPSTRRPVVKPTVPDKEK